MEGIEITASPNSLPSLMEISQASPRSESGESEVARNLFGTIFKCTYPVQSIGTLKDDWIKSSNKSECSVTSSDVTAVASWNLSSSKDDAESWPTQSVLTKEFPVQSARQSQSIFTQTWDQENSIHEPHVYGHDDDSDGEDDIYTEVPPEDSVPSTVCNGPFKLTPDQLAEIYLVFEETRRMWYGEKETSEPNQHQPSMALSSFETPEKTPPKLEPATPPTPPASPVILRDEGDWRPVAESLERECEALKNIVYTDSANLFKLKRAVEAQRAENLQKRDKIESLQLEAQKCEGQLEAVKRENDMYRERESELQDTIDILKKEVDKLSIARERSKASPKPTPPAFRGPDIVAENKSLLEENQMYASQISEYELKLVEMGNSLHFQKTETERLRRVSTRPKHHNEMAELQARLEEADTKLHHAEHGSAGLHTVGETQPYTEALPQTSIQSTTARSDEQDVSVQQHVSPLQQDKIPETIHDLGEILVAIAARLEAVESSQTETQARLNKQLAVAKTRFDSNGMDAINGGSDSQNRLKIHSADEEVEVFLSSKTDARKKNEKNEPTNTFCCDTDSCETWKLLSKSLSS